MERLLAQLDSVCEQAAKGDLDYKDFSPRPSRPNGRGRYQRGVENPSSNKSFAELRGIALEVFAAAGVRPPSLVTALGAAPDPPLPGEVAV